MLQMMRSLKLCVFSDLQCHVSGGAGSTWMVKVLKVQKTHACCLEALDMVPVEKINISVAIF